MGGFASYKLALEYPDLFAQAMPLEGPVICGTRVTPPIESPAGAGQCTSDGNTTPLIVNAKWIPYVMTYGAIDELVPFTGGVEQVEAFNKLGYRYYAVLYPAEDHMVFALQNDFAPATSQLGIAGTRQSTRLVHLRLVPGPRFGLARDRPDAATTGSAASAPATAPPASWPLSARARAGCPNPNRRPNTTPPWSTGPPPPSPTR